MQISGARLQSPGLETVSLTTRQQDTGIESWIESDPANADSGTRSRVPDVLRRRDTAIESRIESNPATADPGLEPVSLVYRLNQGLNQKL